MWINRHWKLISFIVLVILVTGSIQLIEGGACVDNKCLLIVNDPYRFNDATEVIYVEIVEFNHSFIRPLDGGSCFGGSCLLVMRDPFYYGDQGGVVCDVNVNIYEPVEDDINYDNNVFLNFSVTGAATCFYRTSGDWNPIACDYEGDRTMTSGEVTLTVMGVNGVCIGSEQVTFTVALKPHTGVMYEDILIFIPIFCLLMIFMLGENRRKKTKNADKC